MSFITALTIVKQFASLRNILIVACIGLAFSCWSIKTYSNVRIAQLKAEIINIDSRYAELEQSNNTLRENIETYTQGIEELKRELEKKDINIANLIDQLKNTQLLYENKLAQYKIIYDIKCNSKNEPVHVKETPSSTKTVVVDVIDIETSKQYINVVNDLSFRE